MNDEEFWNDSGLTEDEVQELMSRSYRSLLNEAQNDETKRVKRNGQPNRVKSNWIHTPLTKEERDELEMRGFTVYSRWSEIYDIEEHWIETCTEEDRKGFIRKYKWER